MPSIWFMTYCLPVRPMVTTRISVAVPITIPRVVRAKRTLLVRNESMAIETISLISIVFRAVSVNGLFMDRVIVTQWDVVPAKVKTRNLETRRERRKNQGFWGL